jgi:hypothetical protein
MTVFPLQLTSNEQTFKYTFPEEFLNKTYEIGLIKIDGELDIEIISIKCETKVKCFTLNFKNSQVINHNSTVDSRFSAIEGTGKISH